METGVNWEIVTGCENLGGGCESCPSLWEAKENYGVKGHKFEHGYDVKWHADRLAIPMSYDEPRHIWVALGSDLFHEAVPDYFVRAVFSMMNDCSQHLFEVPTKRIERAHKLSGRLIWTDNIALGVTVESSEQKWRIPYLQKIPAKHRAISVCPILGDLGVLELDGISSVGVIPETWGLKRPWKAEWVKNIQRQCEEQGVLFNMDAVTYVPEVA